MEPAAPAPSSTEPAAPGPASFKGVLRYTGLSTKHRTLTLLACGSYLALRVPRNFSFGHFFGYAPTPGQGDRGGESKEDQEMRKELKRPPKVVARHVGFVKSSPQVLINHSRTRGICGACYRSPWTK